MASAASTKTWPRSENFTALPTRFEGDLPEPAGIADHSGGEGGVHAEQKFESFGGQIGATMSSTPWSGRLQLKRDLFQYQIPGLHFGEVQNIVDQLE